MVTEKPKSGQEDDETFLRRFVVPAEDRYLSRPRHRIPGHSVKETNVVPDRALRAE